MSPPKNFLTAPGGADRDAAIRRAFVAGDLRKALLLLNATVPHRYTALFALKDGVLLNRALVDKQSQAVPSFMLEVPMQDSFCQFVFRDGHFQTNDSAGDVRLEGHRLRGLIASYGAAPVTDASGRTIVGSLCHFDLVPQRLTALDSKTLQWAGRMVSEEVLWAAAPDGPGGSGMNPTSSR